MADGGASFACVRRGMPENYAAEAFHRPQCVGVGHAQPGWRPLPHHRLPTSARSRRRVKLVVSTIALKKSSRRFGPFEVLILRDGFFEAPSDVLTHISGEDARHRAITDWGKPLIGIDVNCFALRGPDGLTLVDAGTGTAWGAAFGHARAALQANGHSPDAVERAAGHAPSWRSCARAVRRRTRLFSSRRGLGSRRRISHSSRMQTRVLHCRNHARAASK